ncbi:aldehyde dehydrogenase family protein [Streptomyces cavernae]|uniref:aldehyde dehydrogenase family protein n=1 Tax=Streptomyces cavernae TaxID=2259034 RepID=UPI003B75B538
MTDTTLSAVAFTSHSPATGRQPAEYPVEGPDQIAEAVHRAQKAAAGWAALPVIGAVIGAVIVATDADLDAAADAIVWGAMANAGQTCVGVERVHAVRKVHQALCDEVVERARALRPGRGPDAAYGPMTMPGQAAVVERHVNEAVASGARAVLDGVESVSEAYVEPVVLVDVPEHATVMTEETLGPTVAVNAVADLDKAISRVNVSRYALGAAVFSRNRRTGSEAASRLRSGMVSVNSVLSFASLPALPFGGSGDSGFGRIHGEDGLRLRRAPVDHWSSASPRRSI